MSKDGSLTPYPDQATNVWDGESGESARSHFVCVHTLYTDQDDALWILDPASPAQQGVVEGGAKLLKVNLASNQVERAYPFGFGDRTETFLPEQDPVRTWTCLHYRFKSGGDHCPELGDRKSSSRLLENHTSTKSEPGVQVIVDEVPYTFSPVHADGIAIDPASEYVYYKALTGRTLYRVAVGADSG